MKKQLFKKYNNIAFTVFFTVVALAVVFVWFFGNYDYINSQKDLALVVDDKTQEKIEKKVRHLPAPYAVKAIYMTSWVASTLDWREELVQFMRDSEINSIIIDVKDYSGYVLFDTKDQVIKELGSEEIRVKDLEAFLDYLYDEGIYTIARITVFQDPVYANKFPEVAVQTKAGDIWKDGKGLNYIDPASVEFWEYVVRIARATERVGFDELNFDYIRFPSDGNMKDIMFPLSGPELLNPIVTVSASNTPEIFPPISPKARILERFFSYLHDELVDTGVPISADIFGMTTTNTDDLNIGQILEYTAPYFDYVAPMVYPSHYPRTFIGLSNPAEHPYEVVYYSMSEAVRRMNKASTSPLKLRPWLQDFDLGATYDAEKVRAQIDATYDSGLTSWMIWDPSNRYTRGAYETVDK
jgi:hypothetical protein